MNLDKFLNFIGKNIEYFDINEIKLILAGNYNDLFKHLNAKYQKEQDLKIRVKYENIMVFLNEFIVDYKLNSYKYSIEKSETPEHYKYWIDFYMKNNLLKNATTALEQAESKFPDQKKQYDSLRSKLQKYQNQYLSEYEKTKYIIDKNNKFKHIEFLVGQGELGKAMYESLKYLQEYPNDTKIKNVLKKIDDMKSSNVLESIDTNKDFFDKVGLLHLSKKNELEKSDIKDIYNKLKNLVSKKDFEAGLMLVKYIRDKYKFEDPKLLKYYNKFIDIKTRIQQSKEDDEYNLELKSLNLLLKNRQYQEALIKANSILKKYPFIDKKKVFGIINKINVLRKSIVNAKHKSKFQLWLDNFLMGLSPLTKKGTFTFYEKMSWFLRAKMDLKLSLQIIYYQSKDLGIKKFVKNILEGIDSGMKISEILRWYAQIKQIDVSLIKIGESTGKLGEMFQAIYNNHKENVDRAKKIKSVMIYPIVIIIITILVFVGLMIFVIPKFTSFFAEMGMELPLLTRIMIGISDFIRYKWYFVIAGAIVLGLLLKLFPKTRIGKKVNGYLVLKLPIIKQVVYRKYVIYFASNLAMLLKSGISLLQAIDLLTDGVENVYYQEEFKRIRFELESGSSFSKALGLGNIQDIGQYNNHYIPIDFAYAVDVGEKTGQLWELLEDLGSRYDDDLKMIIKNMQNLMEPFIIVLVGGIVFVFVLSIFLPMISMYSMVSKMGGV